MKIADVLSQSYHQSTNHISDYQTIIFSLLSYIIGQPKTWIWAHPDFVLNLEQEQRLPVYLSRLVAGEPLAYILGEKEFYGLSFLVTPDVLIPRPETERLVEMIIEYAAARAGSRDNEQPLCIVDVGAGSGCIAISLAKHLPTARIVAIDISPRALVVARQNAERHETKNVTFAEGSLLGPLASLGAGQVDAIVANLPYISDDEFQTLDRTVKDFEPSLALRSGKTADELNEQLVEQAQKWLKPGGLLAYETTNGCIIIPDMV